MNVSELKMYSYGVVAEIRTRDDWITGNPEKTAVIVPLEILPNINTEITLKDEVYTISGSDQFGAAYTISVNNSATLPPATWLPFDSTRKTAPDLVVGERVMVWQFANSKVFYWQELGLDSDLRQLESVVYAISGDPTPGRKGLNLENCYYLEMSSRDKRVRISTSNANSEKFTYTFTFDTDLGQVSLKDNDGNYFTLNSDTTTIRMENKGGTWFELNKEQLKSNSIKDTIFESKKLMKLIGPLTEIGDKGLEPGVLGDKLAESFEYLVEELNNHCHIGNLGGQTSPMMAVKPLVMTSYWAKASGSVFSKVLTHH